jgi:hypothetical protein
VRKDCVLCLPHTYTFVAFVTRVRGVVLVCLKCGYACGAFSCLVLVPQESCVGQVHYGAEVGIVRCRVRLCA